MVKIKHGFLTNTNTSFYTAGSKNVISDTKGAKLNRKELLQLWRQEKGRNTSTQQADSLHASNLMTEGIPSSSTDQCLTMATPENDNVRRLSVEVSVNGSVGGNRVETEASNTMMLLNGILYG